MDTVAHQQVDRTAAKLHVAGSVLQMAENNMDKDEEISSSIEASEEEEVWNTFHKEEAQNNRCRKSGSLLLLKRAYL